MLDLSTIVGFDWDDGNARKNERHGVSMAEAEQVYRFGGQAEPFLVFNLAVLLEDLGREPEAIVAYREALALDPQFADAHFNLARLYERARDAKSSLRHLLAYRRMMDQGA